jgi:hypothetical protein
MDAFTMVRTLKARQNAIIDSLPPELRDEFFEIEALIRRIDTLIVEHGAKVKIDVTPRLQHLLEQPEAVPRPGRTPLAERREVLRSYLQARRRAPRGQILRETRIPPGTLSALLTEEEFEKDDEGFWRLRAVER